ncbi:secA translation cis-regulator SecM [Actinobacillus vicugnae]|uniref:secA translation cis-regulator SecM n=1 Tax=Actinobacillus vicugnae TaxID=2573093 RepID=UPI00124116F9|nr:secA translation cis-regulator SecM [Actinobacillus vicugnae]
MSLLKHFHKTPFWSQLVFGLVAIFALPEIQAIAKNEQETVINQHFSTCATCSEEQEQQSLFIAELKQELVEIIQAVVFCEFFTKSYCFDGDSNHPIRAGPVA